MAWGQSTQRGGVDRSHLCPHRRHQPCFILFQGRKFNFFHSNYFQIFSSCLKSKNILFFQWDSTLGGPQTEYKYLNFPSCPSLVGLRIRNHHWKEGIIDFPMVVSGLYADQQSWQVCVFETFFWLFLGGGINWFCFGRKPPVFFSW